MPALGGAKLANIINTTLIHHIRGDAFESSIQDRPLLKRMRQRQKKFAAGRDTITHQVKGGPFQIGFQSFTNDDVVTYGDTNRVQQAEYIWREYHAGIQLTSTELKQAGFVVSDSEMGINATKASDSDKQRLTDLLDDKMTDMMEGMLDSLNTQYWEDGTLSPTDLVGLTGLVTDVPAVGIVAGIDRSLAANAYWRNLAFTTANGNPIVGGVANGGQTLTQIQVIMRQLMRFGGKPSVAYCGSGFLEQMELEFRANGNYSLDGFSQGGDVSVGGLRWKGVDFIYDPTLDAVIAGTDRTTFCYLIDERNVQLRCLDGDDFKAHSPARPEDQYVLNKAVTWSGAITGPQWNTCAVLEVV
jgi:hypothetical protein